MSSCSDQGYCHEGGVQLNYASYAGGNWMAKLPNATTLSQISMPGSHDTMTLGGAEWGPILLTQTMTLIEQLYSGIRMVDMRLVHIGNVFVLNHGSFYLHANFDDVLSTVAAFVRSNPGEVILMRVKKEASNFNGDQSKYNSQTFDQTFQAYEKKYAPLFWNNSGKSMNPSMQSLRGRIVVLQDFNGDVGAHTHGIKYSSFATIEDNYSLDNDQLYSKWNAVRDNLNKAASGPSTATYMTYLSGSGGSTPYFVASGKTLSGTYDSQQLTDVTPYNCSSDPYPDFFHTQCKLGFRYTYYKGTNMLVNDWLSTRKQRVGIVMIDFPGGDLLEKIVGMNF
ncbi:MAG: hypothetical protein WDW38_008554 [Sanguina aurantia]